MFTMNERESSVGIIPILKDKLQMAQNKLKRITLKLSPRTPSGTHRTPGHTVVVIMSEELNWLPVDQLVQIKPLVLF